MLGTETGDKALLDALFIGVERGVELVRESVGQVLQVRLGPLVHALDGDAHGGGAFLDALLLGVQALVEFQLADTKARAKSAPSCSRSS